MIRLSELFEVSTDYLLKDEIENPEYIEVKETTTPLRRVSMEEANSFLSVKATQQKQSLMQLFCVFYLLYVC